MDVGGYSFCGLESFHIGYNCDFFLLMDVHLVQVREHAAAVLAGLMKGGDEKLAKDFRDRAYKEANVIQRQNKRRLFFIADIC